MKKVVSIAVLSLALTACAAPMTKDQLARLDATCAPTQDEQKSIARKEIALGMTPCAVIKSWGEPLVAFEEDGMLRYNFKYSEGFLGRVDIIYLAYKNDVLVKIEVGSLPGPLLPLQHGEVSKMVWGERIFGG